MLKNPKSISLRQPTSIKLGIVEYYSDKEFRATERYIEYYLKYTKLVAKTYIPKLTKLLTQLHAINNVPNAQETFKIRGQSVSSRMYTQYTNEKKNSFFIQITIVFINYE